MTPRLFLQGYKYDVNWEIKYSSWSPLVSGSEHMLSGGHHLILWPNIFTTWHQRTSVKFPLEDSHLKFHLLYIANSCISLWWICCSVAVFRISALSHTVCILVFLYTFRYMTWNTTEQTKPFIYLMNISKTVSNSYIINICTYTIIN